MAQAHSIYCALYFYYYYISSTSDHQALDPGAGDPWFTRLQVTPIHTAPVWYLAHSGHSINILNELIYTQKKTTKHFNNKFLPDDAAKNIIRTMSLPPSSSFYFPSYSEIWRLCFISFEPRKNETVTWPNIRETGSCQQCLNPFNKLSHQHSCKARE